MAITRLQPPTIKQECFFFLSVFRVNFTLESNRRSLPHYKTTFTFMTVAAALRVRVAVDES